MCSLVQLTDDRIMGRLSNRASITKNARSSKKAQEDAEDKVHYLDGVDEDDETRKALEGLNLRKPLSNLVTTAILLGRL